ncbi:hypothetical protein I6I18_04650 [Kytococcus sedentarius]|uniref:Uncharacterized protein n=1 Tax=Kytococcus sedentarius (strain ATCC 14392 / DSM 20547 / JCM 11482 / CCUG 33030 / NBRC 15357 / NCTC 11040 / CCM 314 / 541) TaxID=478801 RepID=C7NHP4_KYTSD|nr:hypothetical protein [Kytococcus sedentarius]ACV06401.1 hypothetical protein Ksed_13730 [Kytococcus sedentarius DSM 20547]QQB64723.1 hypothetical protein I6I18_04650 [Kytococcus sedentarius]STX12178.1 Uncharacterised protein [Kytococcus sedentarius]
MGSGFKLSGNFERDLNRMVQGTVKDIASDYQKMFDSLLRRYEGRPVSEIKPVLRREWSRIGGSISDPELTDYATLISEGTRIQMKVK